MSLTPQKLLGLLADGQVHSGTALAEQLGVTRAAVWKCMQQLESLGVGVAADAGKGYQLEQPVELLDAAAIRAAVAEDIADCIDSIDVLWSTESTNDHLLQSASVAPGRSRACIAEFQTAGRGRRGREWLAPAGAGICLSLSWAFQSSPPQLACLGLVAGVAILRAIQTAGVTGAQLKWPNDVVVDGRKLAGILIDVKGEAGGPLQVVVGVGLNISLPAATRDEILAAGGIAPVSLQEAGAVAGRNAVAAALVVELHRALDEFAMRGFAALADEWRSADYLHGRQVMIELDGERIEGVVRGIASDGRLQLNTAAGIQHFTTGDVSVRLTA
ncbi:MAG: biotin--[acetyl-CoA-carboxylase] ligase [Gammaproteobacteria bacterium]|nr:biotin--[acetyl-CoA-carboxylase] ligase [Gammaproteobacteria bacterium]NND54046.1 biotin--[acetyl-CoA-carboxylase] ligase [Gammaproteobacteria bacterium]